MYVSLYIFVITKKKNTILCADPARFNTKKKFIALGLKK